MAITFQVGFQLEGKGLQKALGSQLDVISKEIDQAFSSSNTAGLKKGLAEAITQARVLETAVKKATTDKGVSYISLNNELRKAGTTASQMVATLANGGKAFSGSLNVALSTLSTANRQAVMLSTKLQEAMRVLSQSIKFTAAAEIQRAFASAVSSAISWVKQLDTEIANIGVVTGKVGSQLDSVYETIIRGANDLRVSAQDYAEAALIFYQQGLDDAEVERRVRTTIMAAEAAGQSVEQMSQQLTAIWNTYGMVGEEQERAASVGAKLAASSAVAFSDIAEAMQTSAAAAAQMGVSYDSLAAIIATVGDTTQQSASVIGNAFKTIFSRFEQLKVDGTDGEITLNAVSSQLQAMGINVLDAAGNLRELDDVIMEVGTSWESYSQKQQLAIAQVVGGTRQYTQFLALMNNFGKYMDLKNIAENEDGSTLVKQFLAVQDTAEKAAGRAKEAWSQAFKDIFKADSMKGFYDTLEKLGKLVGSLIQQFGGLPGILTLVGSLMATNLYGKLTQLTGMAKDFIISLNPKWVIADIEKTFADATARVNQYKEQVKDKMSQSDKDGAAGQNLEAETNASKMKIQFAERIAKINAEIAEKEKIGTAAARENAEALREKLRIYEDSYNASVDQLGVIREALIEEQRQLDLQNEITFGGQEGKSTRDAMLDAIKNENESLVLQDALLEEAVKALEEQKGNFQDAQRLAAEAAQQQAAGVKGAQEGVTMTKQWVQEEERKLTAIQSEVTGLQNTRAEIAKNSQALKQMQGELASAVQKLTEVSLNPEATTENFNEVIKDIKTNFQQGLSDLRIDDATIQRVIDQLDSIGTNADFGDIQMGINNAIEAAQQALKDKYGVDIKVTTTGVDEALAQLQNLERQAQGADSTAKNLKETFADLRGATASMGQGFVKFGAGIMGISTSITNVIKNSNSLGDAFGKMLIQMPMMLMNIKQVCSGLSQMWSVIVAVTGAEKAKSIVDGIQVAMGPAVAGAINMVTGAVGGLLTVLTPVLPILIAIAAAIAVVIAVMKIITAVNEKAYEKSKALADSMIEQADAAKDLSDSLTDANKTFEENYKAMKKAKEAGDDYADSLESMNDAAQAMIDSLKESNDAADKELAADLERQLAVAKLTGEYEKLAEAMKKASSAQLQTSIGASTEAANAAGAAFGKAMDLNGSTSYGQYNASISGGWSSSDEKKASDILAQMKSSGQVSHMYEAGNSISIHAKDDVEDLAAAYEEALKLRAELEKGLTPSELNESEYYQNLCEWIDSSAEAYDAYATAAANAKEETLDLLTTDPAAFFEGIKTGLIDAGDVGAINVEALTIPEDGFGNLEEFEKYKNYLTTVGQQAGIAKSEIDSFLNTDPATAPFAAIDTYIEQTIDDLVALQAEAGLTGDQQKELATKVEAGMRDVYDQLTDEDKKFFLQLDFDPNAPYTLKEQLEQLKEQEHGAKIQVALEVVQSSDDGVFDEEAIGKLQASLGDAGWAQWADQMALQADGTYKFLGSIEDLTVALQDALIQSTALRIEQEAMTIATDGLSAALGRDIEMSLNSVSSVDQLSQAIDTYAQAGVKASDVLRDNLTFEEAAANALISMASEYDSCRDEVLKYQQAMANGNEETKAAAKAALENAVRVEELADKYDIAADRIDQVAKSMKSMNSELDDKAATNAAVRFIRLNDAVDDINDNYDDYIGLTKIKTNAEAGDYKALAQEIRASEEYSGTLDGLKESVGGLLNIQDAKNLSDEFVLENMDLIKQAADGEIEAIDQLQIKYAELLEQELGLEDVNIAEGMEQLQNGALAAGEAIDLMANDSLTTMIEQMFNAMVAAGMTADEIEARFAGIGIDVDVTPLEASMEEAMNAVDYAANEIIATGSIDAETASQTVESTDKTEIPAYDTTLDYTPKPQTETVPVIGADGQMTPHEISYMMYEPHLRADGDKEEVTTTEEQTVTAMKLSNAKKSAGGNLSHRNTSVKNGGLNKGGGSNGGTKKGKSGGGGGSKGSKPKENNNKPVENKKREAMEERYANIQSKIDEVSRSLDRLNKAEDDAWGTQRLRNMQKIGLQLQQQCQNYKELLKQAREYYDADLKATYDNAELNQRGLGADIASLIQTNQQDGTIANREDLIAYWNAYLDVFEAQMLQAAEIYNTTLSDETKEAYENQKKIFEDEQKFVDEQIKLYDQLDATAEKVQDTIDTMVDAIREQVSNVLGQIQYKMEFRLKVNERDLKYLDRLINRMGEVSILNKSDIAVLDATVEKMQRTLSLNAQGMAEGFQVINDLQAAMNKDGVVDEAIRQQVIDFFGVSEEILDDYLRGNGGLPDEIMEFLQNQRDILQDTFDSIIDTLLQELSNIYTRFETWISDTFGNADRTLSEATAWLDQMQTLLDIKGTAGLTAAGQKAQRDIDRSRMDVSVATVKTKYANKVAYQDGAEAIGRQIDKLKGEVEAQYGRTFEDLVKDIKNLDGATKNAVIGYQAGISALEDKQREYVQQAKDLGTEIIQAQTEILNTMVDNIEREKEIAKANIATSINGLFSDIADMASMYDMIEAQRTQTFDDYDKNYHLDRLQREYDDAIADMTEEQLEKLGDWQERLNEYKKEGNKLDEAQLSLLEKALEIELAQAKLADEEEAKKDARDAKNTMRLARDASGNYSYIYSSDQEEEDEDDPKKEAEAQLLQLQYEYKKLLEETQEAYNKNVVDLAGQLTDVISDIDYQLYESSELYRRSVDVKIQSLLAQMEQNGVSAKQVLDIMGDGIVDWTADFSDSTLGIITQSESMDEAIDKFKTALVGPDGYEPGSKQGYYGQILETQRYWAEQANAALAEATEDMGEEMRTTWGLIDEDLTGKIVHIAGPDGSLYATLKIEGQDVAEVTENWILTGDGSMLNTWGEAESQISSIIGEPGTEDPNTITGRLGILKAEMTAVAQHQNEVLDEMNTDIDNWSTNFCNQVQAAIDKIAELILALEELENAQVSEMDDMPAPTITSHNDPEPAQSQPSEPQTQDTSTNNNRDRYLNYSFKGNSPNRTYYLDGVPVGTSNNMTKDARVIQDLINAGIGPSWHSNPWWTVYHPDTLENVFKKNGLYTGGLVGSRGIYELAEKGPELVLNNEDTKNILAAVSTMREAVAERALALGTRNISTGSLDVLPQNTQAIQQQVQIEATFPGVSVAAEVEQALENLLRQVAQYNIDR